MKIENGISLKTLTPEQKADRNDKQLREAAKMYETHFLNQMVKSMRQTVNHEDGLIKQNMAEKIFSEQLDNQYVENWAGKGGVGLADMIYNQIKEKYYDTTKKNFHVPGGMMPIAPKKEASGMAPTDSIQMKALPPSASHKMEYRFEVPDASGPFEAQAPLPGLVLEKVKLGDNWNLLKLDHGQGVTSEVTFPGSVAQIEPGFQAGTGQKLGTIDPSRPVLAWKLDWNQV